MTKLAAVMTTKNEADIVGATLTHLYNEGVANIYIADGMSTDGTRDILAGFPVKVYDDDSPYHRQPYWSTRLAQQAYEDGCDWVLCCDADEFWVALSGDTLADTLADVPAYVGKVYATMWHHLDFEYREPNPKPLPKVAFRARDGIQVTNGNHDANAPGGAPVGFLAIREIQYRGFEHFCRKIIERNATIDPALGAGEGTHHKQYAGWTKEQLEPVWQQMVSRATVYDPIPTRAGVPFTTA